MRSTAKRLARLPSTIKELLARPTSQEVVTVNGWIRSLRAQKRVAFVQINDGSCFSSLQAVMSPEEASSCTVGGSVKMVGTLQDSPGSKQAKELRVTKLELLGSCDADYPIQKKEHTNAFLRRFTHLRPRTDTIASVLRLRDACSSGTTQYLKSTGHISVEAPVLTNSDCEGGSSVFRVEAAELYPSATAGVQDADAGSRPLRSFFDSPTYLTVSSQLYLEAVSASLGRVFTLGPAFRAESSLTSRHLSEFWMLEAELSFVDDLQGIVDVVEGCVRSAFQAAWDQCPDELQYFHKQQSRERQQLAATWPRICYDEAIELLQKHHGPTTWGSDLATEQERWLAEEHFKGPVFVTDYPAALKPFYMRKNPASSSPRGETVACFDLLVPGVGELAGGSLREERLPELQEAMQLKGLDAVDYGWYLDLRRYGSAPHGGFGLGWERLISWISGQENVRECIAFPRAKEGFKI